MRHFCTYFDHNYLPRGLALHRSMQTHCPDFELSILCLSAECFATLTRLALTRVRLFTLAELESFEPRLRTARQNRSLIEFYFTCSPVLPLFVLAQNPQATDVTYLDCDLLFFDRLEALWAEIDGHSIAITPHRFPPALRELAQYGIFNVGLLTFRRDDNARACLEWWRERCIEWCYDRLEGDRFADQKYLDVWPEKFRGVKIIENPSVNLAPWNLAGHKLEWRDESVQADGQPLLVFHFHGLKQIDAQHFDPRWRRYHVKPDSVLIEKIYRPYLRSLGSIASELGLDAARAGWNPRANAKDPNAEKTSWWQRLRSRWNLARGVMRGEILRA
jgi:hypothetical protein